MIITLREALRHSGCGESSISHVRAWATCIGRAQSHHATAHPTVQEAEELLPRGSWKAKHHSQGGSPGHTAHAEPAAPAAPAEHRPSPLPETQAVTSGQMSDALANIGDLAAIYPDSQAQPAAPQQGTAPGCGPAEPQVGCCIRVPQGCEKKVSDPKQLSAAHVYGRLPRRRS